MHYISQKNVFLSTLPIFFKINVIEMYYVIIFNCRQYFQILIINS